MTSTEPSESQPCRRALWQFSLREVMILTIAVAAVLALAVQSRPFHQTEFFDSFNETLLFQTVCARLNLPAEIPASGGGHSVGSNKAVRDYQLHINAPPTKDAGRVVAELRKEVEALLNRQGCDIHGRGTVGEPENNQLSAFQFDYVRGSTEGDIYVTSHRADDDRWELRILIHEFKK
jgi:hypothetical protein